MNRYTSFLASAAIAAAFLVPAFAMANTIVPVYNLQPSYSAPGGGGVWSAYYGANGAGAVSPGTTAIYDGRQAAPIYAGVNPDTNIHYSDQGLLAFQVPSVPISSFASQTLTYDVDKQTGTNPVWVRIRLTDTNQTEYQFVPTSNPAGWHTVDAAAG